MYATSPFSDTDLPSSLATWLSMTKRHQTSFDCSLSYSQILSLRKVCMSLKRRQLSLSLVFVLVTSTHVSALDFGSRTCVERYRLAMFVSSKDIVEKGMRR